MDRDVANESASEFSRWNARSRLFGRLRGLHGLCLTPRPPARSCPELSFRMLFSCADTQSRSTCLSARSRTTPPRCVAGPCHRSCGRSCVMPSSQSMVTEIERDICFVLGHFGLTLGFAWRETDVHDRLSELSLCNTFIYADRQIAPFSSTGESWSQDP